MQIDIDIQNRRNVLEIFVSELKALDAQWSINFNAVPLNMHWFNYPNQTARYFTINLERKIFAWKCLDELHPTDVQIIPSIGHAVELLQWVKDNVERFYSMEEVTVHLDESDPEDKNAPLIEASVKADDPNAEFEKYFNSDTNPCAEIPLNTPSNKRLPKMMEAVIYAPYIPLYFSGDYHVTNNGIVKTNIAGEAMLKIYQDKAKAIQSMSLQECEKMLQSLEGLHDDLNSKLKFKLKQRIQDIYDSTKVAGEQVKMYNNTPPDPNIFDDVDEPLPYEKKGVINVTKIKEKLAKLEKKMHFVTPSDISMESTIAAKKMFVFDTIDGATGEHKSLNLGAKAMEQLKKLAQECECTVPIVTASQVKHPTYKYSPSPWNSGEISKYESKPLKEQMEKIMQEMSDKMWSEYMLKSEAQIMGFMGNDFKTMPHEPAKIPDQMLSLKKWEPEYQCQFIPPKNDK